MGVGKVGELYVEIGADNKPLKTSLRDSEKAVQQVQKDMQSNLTATADKIGKVGTGLTLGITAPYIAGSMAAIKYASDPVSYTHLDVYKRQIGNGCRVYGCERRRNGKQRNRAQATHGKSEDKSPEDSEHQHAYGKEADRCRCAY